MKPFDKLFLYAFSTGIERLGDTKEALKRIDDILNTPEDVLWLGLEDAYQQQHRLKIFSHYDIDTEIGSDIDMNGLPDTILDELFEKSINPRVLKQFVTKEIQKRDGQIQESKG